MKKSTTTLAAAVAAIILAGCATQASPETDRKAAEAPSTAAAPAAPLTDQAPTGQPSPDASSPAGSWLTKDVSACVVNELDILLPVDAYHTNSPYRSPSYGPPDKSVTIKRGERYCMAPGSDFVQFVAYIRGLPIVAEATNQYAVRYPHVALRGIDSAGHVYASDYFSEGETINMVAEGHNISVSRDADTSVKNFTFTVIG